MDKYIEIMNSKATLTSKGQITIPIDIRDMLGVDTKDIIEFTVYESIDGTEKIITIKKDETLEECPVCKGTKEVEGNICFLCEGTGSTHKNPESIFEEVSRLISRSKKYKLDISYDNSEDIPKIKFSTPMYPPEVVDIAQDYIQKKFIAFYTICKADFNESHSLTKKKIEGIVNLLKTNMFKDEVSNWFINVGGK